MAEPPWPRTSPRDWYHNFGSSVSAVLLPDHSKVRERDCPIAAQLPFNHKLMLPQAFLSFKDTNFAPQCRLNSFHVPARGNLAMSVWEHCDQAAAAWLGHANSSPDLCSLQTPPS